MNPAEKGQYTEAVVKAELIRRGYRVAVPESYLARYDILIDLGGGEFERAQVKTGRKKDAYVVFNTSSTGMRSDGYQQEDYEGEVDSFIVHVDSTDEIYRIPIEDATKKEMRLRTHPTKNNQKQGINWAEDYELDL